MTRAVTVVALLACAVLFFIRGRPSAPSAPAARDSSTASATASVSLVAASPDQSRREVVDVPPSVPQSAPSASASLSIDVVDENNGPIPGAEVELAPFGGAPTTSSSTGPTGHIEFGLLPSGVYAVTARHDQHAPRSLSRVFLDAGGERTLRIQLAPGWSLRGRVVQADGTPVPGASIALRPGSEWRSSLAPAAWKRTLTCDAHGEFRCDGLKLEAVLVSADDGQGFGQCSVEPSESTVVVTLQPGVPIRGTLREIGSGAPVAGAELIDEDDARVWTRSTSEGDFTFTAPEADLRPCLVRSPRHVTTPALLDQREVALVYLPRRANVAFTVRGPDDAPREGATISLRSSVVRAPSGAPWQFELHTDERGLAASRPDVPAGLYGIYVACDGLGSLSLPETELHDRDEPTQIVARFPGLENVLGMVSSPDGAGLPGVRVSAFFSPPNGEPAFTRGPDVRTLTKADGCFGFHLGTAGAWWLRFEKLGYVSRSRALRVEAGTAVQRLDEKLPPGQALHGIVSDPRGTPVAGASVWIADATRFEEITTDSSGAFSAPWATDDPCLLEVFATGFATRLIRDVPGDSGLLEIVLEPCGKLRGLVLSEADGLPIREFELRLVPGGAEPDEVTSALANLPLSVRSRDGRFELDELRPGIWGVEIRAHGHAPWQGEAVCGASGEERLVAYLSPSGSIQGVVRERGSGAPIAGAKVELFEMPTTNKVGRAVASTETGGSGAFELDGFSTGDYHLVVERAGFVADRRKLSLGAPGHPFVIRCELLPSVSFFGTVFDAEGRVVPDAVVFVQGKTSRGDQLWQIVHSDEKGLYRLEGVELGQPFHLTATKQVDGEVRREERRVTIEADGQEVSLVLR